MRSRKLHEPPKMIHRESDAGGILLPGEQSLRTSTAIRIVVLAERQSRAAVSDKYLWRERWVRLTIWGEIISL